MVKHPLVKMLQNIQIESKYQNQARRPKLKFDLQNCQMRRMHREMRQLRLEMRQLRREMRQLRLQMRQLRREMRQCVAKCLNCVAKCVKCVAIDARNRSSRPEIGV